MLARGQNIILDYRLFEGNLATLVRRPFCVGIPILDPIGIRRIRTAIEGVHVGGL